MLNENQKQINIISYRGISISISINITVYP